MNVDQAYRQIMDHFSDFHVREINICYVSATGLCFPLLQSMSYCKLACMHTHTLESYKSHFKNKFIKLKTKSSLN